MNIGIFGGSFNPVHLGHYEIVRQLHLSANIDKVIVVPTFQNPLKRTTPVLPNHYRKEMLEKTFSSFKTVEISSFELDNKNISYTHNTLAHYKKIYKGHQFYLIVGEDAFASFHLWAEVDTIFRLAKILVFFRPTQRTHPPGALLFSSSPNVKWLSIKIPDISATEIRDAPVSTVIRNNWLHPNAVGVWKHFKQHT
jgi:nicotinate-nucleotide adenylyltransferase